MYLCNVLIGLFNYQCVLFNLILVEKYFYILCFIFFQIILGVRGSCVIQNEINFMEIVKMVQFVVMFCFIFKFCCIFLMKNIQQFFLVFWRLVFFILFLMLEMMFFILLLVNRLGILFDVNRLLINIRKFFLGICVLVSKNIVLMFFSFVFVYKFVRLSWWEDIKEVLICVFIKLLFNFNLDFRKE